jgi:hypothetical protein
MWPGLGLEETMATQIAPDTNGRQDVSRRLFNFLVIGGVCGLAWAAGFRGWMVQLAGSASTFTWGTFIWVLLQGTIIGTLLGWADYRRRTGNTRGRRWLIWSPLLFATAVLGQLEVFLFGGLRGWRPRRCHIGHRWRLRAGRPRSPLDPHRRGCAGGPVHDSGWGHYRRRYEPGIGPQHPAGRLGGSLVLVIYGCIHPRLRHPRAHRTSTVVIKTPLSDFGERRWTSTNPAGCVETTEKIPKGS